MRRACPCRGENPGPGKDVQGELDHRPGIREHALIIDEKVKAQICWKSVGGITGPTGWVCLVFGVELLANGSDLTKLKFDEP